jgi:F-box/leucine-rich repeat protein 2/20
MKIAQNCTILENIDISWCKQLTNLSIIEISKYCLNLKSLKIDGCSKITFEIYLHYIIEKCLKLDTIDTANFRYSLSDTNLVEISKNCLNLKRLFLYARSITDVGFIAIIQKSVNIENLYISYSINVTDMSLIEISKHCLNLRVIVVHDCNTLTGTGLLLIANNCKNLTTVHVVSCANINESIVNEIKNSFPKLKVVFYDDDI